MGFRARRKPDPVHTCDYREGAARVTIELEQLQAMHGRQVMVSSAKVLDLLNPRGMWRYIHAETEPMPAQDTDVDPMTGCKPVTAKTGLDKVQDAVTAARGGPAPPPVQGYA